MNELVEQILNLPTTYYVTYRCHLIESLRVKTGLSKVVDHTTIIEAQDLTLLGHEIAARLGRVVMQGGLYGYSPLASKLKHPVLPNVTKSLTNIDLGVFIPVHMIAYIETITTIKALQPGADEDDTEVPIQ